MEILLLTMNVVFLKLSVKSLCPDLDRLSTEVQPGIIGWLCNFSFLEIEFPDCFLNINRRTTTQFLSAQKPAYSAARMVVGGMCVAVADWGKINLLEFTCILGPYASTWCQCV